VRLARKTPGAIVFDLLGILAAVTSFYLIGRFTRGEQSETFISYAAAGIAVLRLQLGLVQTTRTVDTDTDTGTLEIDLMAAVPAWLYALGSAAYNLLRASLLGVVVILLVNLGFGVELEMGAAAFAGIALGLAGGLVLMLGVAMIVIGIMFVFRHGPAMTNLVTVALPVLAGAYFPLRVMPQPLEAIAEATPFHLPVDLIRRGVLNAEVEWGKAALLFLASGVLLAIGIAIVNVTSDAARRAGSLARP
jgi:ABC-type polysaccharide/polyol phosphate export permease